MVILENSIGDISDSDSGDGDGDSGDAHRCSCDQSLGSPLVIVVSNCWSSWLSSLHCYDRCPTDNPSLFRQ